MTLVVGMDACKSGWVAVALARYRLSKEEAEAIIDGDVERLEALGVEVDALIEPVPSFAARRRRNRERFRSERHRFEPIDLLEQ
jgi:hypothetical protein